MQNAAAATSPRPHSQTLHTFRCACAGTAAGTGLGTVPLVRFYEHSPMPNGLVIEHGAKRSPARIKDGFCHPRAGKSRAVHVTNADQGVFPDNTGGLFVQKISSLGLDLPMYFSGLRFSTRALSTGKLCRRFTNMARVPDFCPRGQRSKVFQPKINANLSGSSRQIVRDLADEVQIPAPFGVLVEASGTDIKRDRTRQPKPIFVPKKSNGIAVDLERSCTLKWNPAQGPLGATARPPARTVLCSVSTDGKIFTYSLNRVAMQSEFFASSAGQLDQIEAARPASVQPPTIVMNTTAVIPDLINLRCHTGKTLSSSGILNAVTIRQNHPQRLIGLRVSCKIFSPENHYD